MWNCKDRITSPKCYYFQDSIAYTEDGNPVQGVHFYEVPPEVAEDTLKAYFKMFGNVLEWRLGKDLNEKSKPCLSGDVLFANAEDAARVLKCYPRELYGIVNPSYSWQQPNSYGPTEDQDPQESAPFLNLNDDCWFYILRFLDLPDKLRFGSTCQRFRMVYQMATAGQYKSVNLHDFCNLRLVEILYFFQMSGDEVQDIVCMPPLRCPDQMLSLIADYCRNLMSLTLSHTFATNDSMLKLPTSIEKLDLYKCSEIKDFLKICKRLTKLRELSLPLLDYPDTFWSDIVKENGCPFVEVLHISAFDDIEGHSLAQLPNLKSLTISFMYYSDDPSKGIINQLVEHKAEQLERFEDIEVGELAREQLSLIAKLTGLRALILPYMDGINDEVLNEFADLKKLEELHLYCNNVSYCAIMDLFISCPKLSHLGVFGLSKPVFKLLQMIVEQVIQEKAGKGMHRKLPIELEMNSDNRKTEALILRDPDAVPESIIKINNHYKYPYYYRN